MKSGKLITLLLFFLIAGFNNLSLCQKTIGKITYYEGSVKAGKKDNLLKVKLNQDVQSDFYLETAKESILEITWSNGNKSTLPSNKLISAEDLYSNNQKDVKNKTADIKGKIGGLLKGDADKKKQQEGGIRRDMFGSDSLITFETALGFYSAGDYVKAIESLNIFMGQTPDSADRKEAMFTLAMCMMELDLLDEAEELFELFTETYPDDPLSEYAEKILDEF